MSQNYETISDEVLNELHKNNMSLPVEMDCIDDKDKSIVNKRAVVKKTIWEYMTSLNPTYIKMIVLFLYIFVGTVYYTNVEGWLVTDAWYFIIVTVTTVGYGHFHPSSDNSKVFTIFYILFGVPIVGTIINEITNVLMTSCQDYLISMYFLKYFNTSKVPERSLKLFRMYLCFFMVLVYVLIGGLFYYGYEDWNWLTSAYFAVITMSTVGYGELLVSHPAARIFAIYYVFTSTGVFITTVARIIDVFYVPFEIYPKNTVFSKDKLVLDILCEVSSESKILIDRILKQLDDNKIDDTNFSSKV